MSTISEIKEWMKNSAGFKLAIIGVLILLLLIPQGMIKSLIRERISYRNEVIHDICSKWAYSQYINGPILTIPFKQADPAKPLTYITKNAHFLPEKLFIDGKIEPEIRYRGIYKVVVYNSKLQIKGNFAKPDIQQLNLNTEDILWDEAYISLGINDMRGIKKKINILWDNQSVEMQPGIPSVDVINSGVSAKIPIPENNISFDVFIDLNGSEMLSFTPVGKETIVKISSPWNSPSFDGSFLPDNRNITADGFTADWNVLNLNRNYPQQWIGSNNSTESSQFGVKLLFPVDQYLKTERSAKYAIMFIFLTFTLIFFFERFQKRRIHFIQYFFIGAALIIFYSLLLSLSEHIPFTWAYLVSATAVISLILSYTYSMIKSVKSTAILGISLVSIYLFLYTTLQIEDYSLLIGSIGVFAVLAILMFFSRKIEWGSN
ncbi:MAG: cell envelope integrity protein CreD [Bacteroidales bacterium]|nr:cell envelope integrity protein CreD [Bacteroidales bacterium]MDD4576016.1 cell envelope integrity protein CreD [Bacteroidales bacterium]